MRQLTLLRNAAKIAEYALDLPDVIVGRGRSAHIRLDENTIASRQHCVVRERANGHVVEDLGGRNGTFVNGRKIDVHTLRPGDRITLGEDTLRYDLGTGTATSLADQVAAQQAKLAEDSGVESLEEIAFEDVANADELRDVREANRARAEDAPPASSGLANGLGERTASKESTMVADKADLERMLAELAKRQGPHVVRVGTDPEEITPLRQSPTRVGFGEACGVRLPGRRWLPGRVGASLVDNGGWCVVPESSFWLPVRVGDGKLTKLRRLESGDVFTIAGHEYEFRRGEQR